MELERQCVRDHCVAIIELQSEKEPFPNRAAKITAGERAVDVIVIDLVWEALRGIAQPTHELCTVELDQ